MTKVLIALLVVATVFVAFRVFASRGSGNTDGGFVTLAQLPALVNRIATTGKNGAFWVLLIPNTARADGFDANLQVSMEGDHLGIDWVLLAKRNLEDRARFEEIVKSQGLESRELVRNDVHYLRVESSDRLAERCKEILESMYGVTETTGMRLIINDFTWP